jgi:hypothetical protein
MPIRLKHTVIVQASQDTAGKQKLFWQDEALSEVVGDNFERIASGTLSIAALATEDVPTGDIDAIKGVYLEVSQQCTVRLNGSTDDIVMTPTEGVTGGVAKMFLEAAITQIEIENTNATEALTGVYCLWGDLTP